MSIADALKQKTGFTENTKVADKYGNVFTVPKGFKIATPTTENAIVYKEPTNPTVQDGIVIEDASNGNQFVWIPVGTLKNGNEAGVSNAKITLARRIFKETNEDGKCAVDVEKEDGSAIITCFIEQTKEEQAQNNKGNAVAKEIGIFIDGVSNNGGYYLARFEASYGEGGKVASKKSTGTVRGISDKSIQLTEGMLWNWITQADASTNSQAMYNDDGKTLGYQSDLVNSYAWDTAIYYIQECSEDKDYAMQCGESQTRKVANTGESILTSDGKKDQRCNICDMAGNVWEWSTETSTKVSDGLGSVPCVFRGGLSSERYHFTSERDNDITDETYSGLGFRPILYVK